MSKGPIHVLVEANTRYTSENERLIKKFSRKVKKNGIMDLVRKRRFFNTKRKLYSRTSAYSGV